MMKVDLKKIVEGIEFQGDESRSYLKKSSGEVVLFTDDEIAAAKSWPTLARSISLQSTK